MVEEPTRRVPLKTSTHRVFANDSALVQQGKVYESAGAAASLLRVPDFGRCVNNLESNLRKTFGAAKRTLVSAGKSMSCVSVVESKGSIKGEYPAGMENNDESASDDGETPMPILMRMPTGTLFEKATHMAQELEVIDRQHHLKNYKKCFVGSQAVEWMIKEEWASDSESAVQLGKRMAEQGLLKHVTGGHVFEDKEYFYKFSDAVMSMRDMSPPVANLSSDVAKIDRRVAHLLSQLKLHRSLNVALFEQASEQQQKLEENARELVRQVSSVENTLALQLIISGILLFTIVGGCIGFFCKAVGVLMLWRGGKLLIKSQDAECNYQHGLQKGGEDTFASCSLLDQLRGAGSLPEGSETTSGNAESVPMEKKNTSVVPEPVTPPTQEDYANCPDRPCLLRLNRSLGYQKGGNKDEKRWLRMNTGEPFAFETRIFKGNAVLYVAGLDTSPPGLFQGRKRKTHLVVQGQFKRPMRFADVLTGQDFARKLQHIPALPVLNLLLRMAKRLSPSMLAGLEPRPHVLAPVAAGAQVINCSKPGEEPALDNPTEDMRLLGQKFVKGNGNPLSSTDRRRIMSDHRNHSGLVYDTQYIWTFHFWQHLLDLSTFKLDMSLRQFSLSGHLDNQPLQLMAKDRASDEYLWSFEAWHESLLSNDSISAEE